MKTMESIEKYTDDHRTVLTLDAGGAIVPPVMGLVSDFMGLTASLAVFPMCMLVIGYASIARARKSAA